MRLLLAASLVLLPAHAMSAPSPNDGGKPEASKKICKVDDEEDTGSRLRRRICKTEAEWNKLEGAKAEADRPLKQPQ